MKLLGVVFTGSVLATCSAVTAVSLDVSSMAKDAPTVTKTVFSSKMRLVFAVGVEGTGHGFVNQVNDHMFNTNDQLVAIPRVDTVSAGRYYIFISMRSDVHHYNAVLDNAREQMQNLAKRAAELPFPGTMVLMQGKSSYPVGWGPNKVMKYLDLRMLAEVAEEKGVDFRVLYLQRSVKDMIIANTVHRSFQK